METFEEKKDCWDKTDIWKFQNGEGTEEKGILPGAFSGRLSRVSASWRMVTSSTEVRALAGLSLPEFKRSHQLSLAL